MAVKPELMPKAILSLKVWFSKIGVEIDDDSPEYRQLLDHFKSKPDFSERSPDGAQRNPGPVLVRDVDVCIHELYRAAGMCHPGVAQFARRVRRRAAKPAGALARVACPQRSTSRTGLNQ
jgi:hypothetical protein